MKPAPSGGQAGCPSHLERIADLLPPEHRETWVRAAAQFREATADSADELWLLGELIAFSGLITREVPERIETLTNRLTDALTARAREEGGAELSPEALEELKGTVRAEVNSALPPGAGDWKDMAGELSKAIASHRVALQDLKFKAPAPSPAGVSSSSGGGSALKWIMTTMAVCLTVFLGGAGALGWWLWQTGERTRRDVITRLSEQQITSSLASTAGGLEFFSGHDSALKRPVRAIVVDPGIQKVLKVYVDAKGRAVVLLPPGPDTTPVPRQSP